MIRILHFADLHLGIENYSRIDPATGLSTCFLDFLATLDEVVDFALENEIDLVLFCGNVFKSHEPSQTHQHEFATRIRKLATGRIPVFLLAGKYDLLNTINRATTVDIFDTLAISNVTVAKRSDIYTIETKEGPIQIVALPWFRQSDLLSQEQTRHLGVEETNLKLEMILTKFIEFDIKRLDPNMPSILAAHVSLAEAGHGSENTVMIRQDPLLTLGNVASPAFDYIALGHIHKNQVLSYNPPVVYAGSLQRIDFSDEEDTKGFYVVEIDSKKNRGERATFDFHPVKARRFLTAKVRILSGDINPTESILQVIADQEQEVRDALLRIQIIIPEHLVGLVREQEIYKALKETQHASIFKEVERERQTILSSRSMEGMSPEEALNIYIDLKKIPRDRARLLQEYGERLIQETMSED